MSTILNKIIFCVILAVCIWIISSIYLSQFTTFYSDSSHKHAETETYFDIPSTIESQFTPDISQMSPFKYDFGNIPSSIHTIPSLFIIAVPKSGSSSLIKWLINTELIFGDIELSPNRVENNVIWKYYVDSVITRNQSIGFYLSDQTIVDYNDWDFIGGFMAKLARKNKYPNSFRKNKKISEKKWQSKKFYKKMQNRHKLPKRSNRKLLRKRDRHRHKYLSPKRHLSYTANYTVGKSVFYFHLPYMARLFAIKYPNTKILITVRNPISRLKSNFLFFIGDEMKKLPKLYGNVNLYLEHIIGHKLLQKPFAEMKGNLTLINNANSVQLNDSKWNLIFRAYKMFLVNMIRLCKEEFAVMGFREKDIQNSCKERDLIRSAFGVSCYIVPIMYWYLINFNPKRNFRILQSELMFENSEEYIAKILCWVKMDGNDGMCDGLKSSEWNSDHEWRKSDGGKLTMDINDGLKSRIKNELGQCRIGLEKFVEMYPFVQLLPLDLRLWVDN